MLHKQKETAQHIRQELKISGIFFAAGMVMPGMLLYFWDTLAHVPCEGLLCALLGGTFLGGWCVCWRWFSAEVSLGLQPSISNAMLYYGILVLGGPVLFWPSVIWRLWKLNRFSEPEDPWHSDSVK